MRFAVTNMIEILHYIEPLTYRSRHLSETSVTWTSGKLVCALLCHAPQLLSQLMGKCWPYRLLGLLQP